jgi:hypothetical protein
MENTNIPTHSEPGEPQAPETDDRPPLWKQILGAVIGGGLALALYYGYEYAKPQVAAYLTLPAAEGGRMFDLGASNIADKTMDPDQRKRILSRNIRVAGEIEDRTDNPQIETADTHALDIAWPGHDPEDEKYEEVLLAENLPLPEVDEGDYNNALFEEEVATKSMDAGEDEWDNLWDDIREREERDDVVHSDAAALPDTGFGIGFLIAGAAGGAASTRIRKKKKSNA